MKQKHPRYRSSVYTNAKKTEIWDTRSLSLSESITAPLECGRAGGWMHEYASDKSTKNDMMQSCQHGAIPSRNVFTFFLPNISAHDN